MLKNYLATAWRNTARNKAFSFINIFGLGLGMARSLLIFLWVHDERSIDTAITKADVYDVYENRLFRCQTETTPEGPGLLAAESRRTLPEIEYSTGFYNENAGTREAALAGLQDMAVSRKLATAFFGSPAAAFGKTIRVANERDFRVNAVFLTTYPPTRRNSFSLCSTGPTS